MNMLRTEREGVARKAVLLCLPACLTALVAGCGAESDEPKVPAKLGPGLTARDGRFWKALSSAQKTQMVRYCRAQAASALSTAQGAVEWADPEYQQVMEIGDDELRARLDRHYATTPNIGDSIKDACLDETKALMADDGAEGSAEGGASSISDATVTHTNEDWGDVWNTGADGLEGDRVKLAGHVYQDTGNALLLYGDPENDELPTVVYGSWAGIGEGDYVLVKGAIDGSDSYDTVAGGTVDVVQVTADSVRRISEDRAIELAHPATGGVRKLHFTETQAGFTVTIKSIAWTDQNTRVKVQATNNGGAKAALSAYDAAIQQGSHQYELDDSDRGADELSQDIRPGVTKTATLTFERISRRRGEAYLEFEWLSDDYTIDSDTPFAFNLSWKP